MAHSKATAVADKTEVTKGKEYRTMDGCEAVNGSPKQPIAGDRKRNAKGNPLRHLAMSPASGSMTGRRAIA